MRNAWLASRPRIEGVGFYSWDVRPGEKEKNLHVEDVRHAAVRVDVPDDLVIKAHVEDWVVGKDISICGKGRKRKVSVSKPEYIDLMTR